MNAIDWITAVSGLVAAIVSIITLITVYIGAMQLLSQNRIYRHGLSWRSIGPWQSAIANWALFGLQRRIFTPTVNLKSLVESHWNPRITFPIGFPKEKNDCVEKGRYVQAKASWVNFMQALGLSPEDNDLYEIRDASELINGIVPMHWTGKDLAGICSILGFQSHEDTPSFKSPMPLPMQWSGPLGWLQFRSSGHGCVAEFRRRMDLHNQIPKALHEYYSPHIYDIRLESDVLRSRLWNSINGFALEEGRILYLGGRDRHQRPQEAVDEADVEDEILAKELMTHDLSTEEIMRKLFGKKESRSKALRREAKRSGSAMTQRALNDGDGDIHNFLTAMRGEEKDSRNKMEVLRPCPGLLSVSVQGELAYNRGLSVTNCKEYYRKSMEAEDIDSTEYPYHLGDLYMDNELLPLMKEALLLLQPDGFYFSPTGLLCCDLREIYKDIEDQSNVAKEIFPRECVEELEQEGECKDTTYSNCPCLCFAMKLCNELQRTRKTARACFSVDDMQLIAKAASALRQDVSKPPANKAWQDLVWAVLYCGELSRTILKALKTADMAQFVAARISCKDGVLNYEALVAGAVKREGARDENLGRSKIPLVADGEFTGRQMLTAIALVFITYYWIDKRWITDVAAYDMTMPQSILMC